MILFASQRKVKTIKKLNIKYQDIEIKQRSQVTYLDCVMDDETMSGEPMALKVINEINGKSKFLYRKIVFDTWASTNAMQCPHTTTFRLGMLRVVP